jgi:hypothetical protein
MHTYGTFLESGEDVLGYMDRFNVEKAIITTINRTKFHTKGNLKETSEVRNKNAPEHFECYM